MISFKKFLSGIFPNALPAKEYKAVFTVVLTDGSEHELRYNNLPVRDIKIEYREVGT
jgi:hypothetical protein